MVKHALGKDRRASLSVAAVLLAIAVIVSACQSPMVSSGASASGTENGLSLSFLVQGTSSTVTGSTPAKTSSRLILPTVESLAVTLTPLDPGLATPNPQTVDFAPSAGTQLVSVAFPGIAWGKYTIKAEASDQGGNVLFRQSSNLTVSGTSTSVTLNLLPANVDVSTVTEVGGTYNSFSLTLNPASSYTYEIPAAGLSTGGTIPAGSYQLNLSGSPSGCYFYAQDADGTLILSGYADPNGGITTSSETGVTSIFVTPSSSSSPSYLTIYNSDTVNSGSIFVTLDYSTG